MSAPDRPRGREEGGLGERARRVWGRLRYWLRGARQGARQESGGDDSECERWVEVGGGEKTGRCSVEGMHSPSIDGQFL